MRDFFWPVLGAAFAVFVLYGLILTVQQDRLREEHVEERRRETCAAVCACHSAVFLHRDQVCACMDGFTVDLP